MPAIPGPDRLLAIIDLQNTIAAASMTLDGVLRVVVDCAGKLTAASGAVVELVEGGEMVYRAVSGSAAGAIGTRLKSASSLSGLCVQQRIPLRCDDTETDPRVDREACRRAGIGSMICAPLFRGADAVGALKVVSDETGAFSGEDLATLELLATVIGSSLHRAREHEQVLHQSLHDTLTGLSNRRSFDTRLVQELDRHRRYGRPLCLVMLDLDGFKGLNDRQGHAAGDEALRAVARILKAAIRVTDDCFRLGGDEFAVLLPDTPRAGAVLAIDRIRAGIAAARLGDGAVGISAGLVEAAGQQPAEFQEAADASLTEEKRRKQAPTPARP